MILAGIGAATIGGIMVAALPQPPLGIQVDAAALGRLPGMSVKSFKFSQSEIHIKAGDSFALRLDNDDEGPHSFDIDELNVHAPMASHSSSIALLTHAKPGTYTFYCAVGTHRQNGMVGTLVVDQ